MQDKLNGSAECSSQVVQGMRTPLMPLSPRHNKLTTVRTNGQGHGTSCQRSRRLELAGLRGFQATRKEQKIPMKR